MLTDSFKHTDKTKSIKDKLEESSGYPVKILSMEEFTRMQNIPFALTYLGIHHFNGVEHYIGVNFNKPDTIEHTFIHECLHASLDNEGYPKFRLTEAEFINADTKNASYRIACNLCASIHHPEIYRRMTVSYSLDMRNYFQALVEQKRTRFLKANKAEVQNEIESVFYSQQDIVDGFEYNYYTENEKIEINKIFQVISPSAYDCLNKFQKKIHRIYSAKDCYSAANIILVQIKEYGRKRGADIYNEHIWNNIKVV